MPKPNELTFDDLLRAGVRVPLQDEPQKDAPRQEPQEDARESEDSPPLEQEGRATW